MSTRALICAVNEFGYEVLTYYKHYDGYPEGLGCVLANFLKRRKFKSSRGLIKSLTGILFKELKDVHEVDTLSRNMNEEFVYYLSIGDNKNPVITIEEQFYVPSVIFHGTTAQFNTWIEMYKRIGIRE